MKSFILKHIIIFTLAIVSGGFLMNVSQKVQHVEREIKAQNRDMDREEESIRTLKAEWAYLNDPARLEILATGGLDLVAPNIAGLISKIDDSVISPIFIPVPQKSPLHIDISYSGNKNVGQP